MADLVAATWSQQDSNNTATSPAGVQGSYSPSQVAPIIRAIMGATKRFYDQSNPIFTSTGTGAAYVLTYLVAPQGGYTKGVIYRWFAHTDSTGPATLNINSLGAKSLFSRHGLPLTNGMIKAGDVVECFFDGTSFELLSAEKHDPRFTGTLTANAATIAALTGNTAAFTGAVSALTFTGNGAALTALNGSNIASGTVADARLPTTMAGKTFTTNVVASNGITAAYGVKIARDGVDRAYIGVDGSFMPYIARYGANNAILSSIDLNNDSATGFRHNGSTVWTAANDGAGSTLDADLLDGQQGTYYRDLTNSTGTLNNARLVGNYSFDALTLNTGLVASNIRSLNGQEIVLNAGEADGYFTGQTDEFVYINAESGLQINASADNWSTGWAGRVTTTIDRSGITWDGNKVFHAGNDGSGSGLDADLLDGQHGSYFRDLSNSTGTLPNARISGDYDGIGVLKLTNRLEVSGSAPNIRMLDTTSGQYSARLRVDSNNAYFDSSTDDVNFGEVFRFELDAKVGYVNNSKIHTDSNHNHLSIGTSASSARSALGLGNLATENWSDLVYNGSSNTNTTFPVGDTVLASTNNAPARNGVQSIYIYDELNYQYTNNSGSSAGTLSGTWRFKGGANSMGLWRRTA